MGSAVVLVELSIVTYSINAWMNAGDGGNESIRVAFARDEAAWHASARIAEKIIRQPRLLKVMTCSCISRSKYVKGIKAEQIDKSMLIEIPTSAEMNPFRISAYLFALQRDR